MKAEDLMVGDWVTFNDCEPNEIVPIKIAALGTSELYAHIDNDEVCDVIGYHELTGIPLTPEILERNGFENDFYEDESVADYVKVRLEGYSLRCKANGWDDALVTWCNGHLEVVTDFNGEVRKDIDHIHELQHVIRLCGVNKEIVL